MTVKTNSDSDLRADIRTLIESCHSEVARLTSPMRKGQKRPWDRGRANAYNEVAVWLERLTGNALDFATNVNDLTQCLEQSVEDERSDIRPVVHRRTNRRQDAREARRHNAAARGRATVYADIKEVLAGLLAVYYPDQQFPLTFTAGISSYDEMTTLDEWPVSAPSACDERMGLSELVGADMH